MNVDLGVSRCIFEVALVVWYCVECGRPAEYVRNGVSREKWYS